LRWLLRNLRWWLTHWGVLLWLLRLWAICVSHLVAHKVANSDFSTRRLRLWAKRILKLRHET
jgi:hypothetical protein